MIVLIVEDNKSFSALVAQHLERAGFATDQVESIGEAERATSTIPYVAIVLDLGLRDGDGIEFLRSLRRRGDSTPVIITTARHGLEDRVCGLREGADDYLAKPFSVDELIARLYALVRRPQNLLGQSMRAGNVALDTQSRQVNVADRVHPMPIRCTRVLELLMRHLGSVVPRHYVDDQLFGIDGQRDLNTVDVYIHRLRKQLDDAGATVKVHTIRGVGYMMTEVKHNHGETNGPRDSNAKPDPRS